MKIKISTVICLSGVLISTAPAKKEQKLPNAAMVTELDDYVGELLKKLKEFSLENNTIVIFASDNGPHLEAGGDPDYFNSNGDLKGYKLDMYEGGIRS